MNRILRGAVVLAASALALGCNTEPDELGGGDPTEIVADPGVVFVARGDSQAVLVRLVDQQGTALESPITITGATSPISVSVDSLFRPVFAPDGSLIANTKNTELRLFVRGDELGATTFTVTAGGLTKTVAVTVTPVGITPGLSNASPQIAEPVTVTAEAGLTFTPESRLVDAAGELVAYTLDVAGDGTTMTVVFLPGFSGTYTITHVIPSYAPTLEVDLPATTSVTVAGTVAAGFSGVDAVATAPALAPANAGNIVGIIDNGTTFPGTLAGSGTDGVRYYKLVVEEAGSYVVDLSWPGGKDLAIYVLDESGTVVLASDDAGGLNDSNETAHADLAPGTYYIAAGWFDYGANPVPDYININVTTE